MCRDLDDEELGRILTSLADTSPACWNGKQQADFTRLWEGVENVCLRALGRPLSRGDQLDVGHVASQVCDELASALARSDPERMTLRSIRGWVFRVAERRAINRYNREIRRRQTAASDWSWVDPHGAPTSVEEHGPVRKLGSIGELRETQGGKPKKTTRGRGFQEGFNLCDMELLDRALEEVLADARPIVAFVVERTVAGLKPKEIADAEGSLIPNAETARTILRAFRDQIKRKLGRVARIECEHGRCYELWRDRRDCLLHGLRPHPKVKCREVAGREIGLATMSSGKARGSLLFHCTPSDPNRVFRLDETELSRLVSAQSARRRFEIQAHTR